MREIRTSGWAGAEQSVLHIPTGARLVLHRVSVPVCSGRPNTAACVHQGEERRLSKAALGEAAVERWSEARQGCPSW